MMIKINMSEVFVVDIDDLRSKSSDELRAQLDLCHREWVDLLFKKKCGQPVNTARFGITRKLIARILTVFVERGERVNV